MPLAPHILAHESLSIRPEYENTTPQGNAANNFLKIRTLPRLLLFGLMTVIVHPNYQQNNKLWFAKCPIFTNPQFHRSGPIFEFGLPSLSVTSQNKSKATFVYSTFSLRPFTNHLGSFENACRPEPPELWSEIMRRYDLANEKTNMKTKNLLRTPSKSNSRDLWPLRQQFQCWQLRTWTHDNHHDLTLRVTWQWTFTT